MDKQQEESEDIAELGRIALQANEDYLDTLKTRSEKLEAELETLDKLIDVVDAIDESDLDLGSYVTVPGSVRAAAPVTTRELLLPESPFHKDALRRSRYRGFSEIHPMKTKELAALAKAVQAESYRIHALDNQKSGASAFPNLSAQAIPVLGVNAEGIEWERVAEKVSAVSMTKRSARECEIRWKGEQHPEFNHGPWSPEETLKARFLADEFADGCPDWQTVAERLGTHRTPLDCMRHAMSRKSHQWTEEADQRLLKAVSLYGHDNWFLVARYVSEDATPLQCSNRFQKTLDESIKRIAWSPEEDSRLSAAVAAYGSSWVDVAASIPGRHNDQCRERWTEQLDPGINRSPWSDDEDKVLLDYVREHKGASWKTISGHLRNGRTEDMCRNRYAVLQRDANVIPAAMPAVDPKAQASAVGQQTCSPLASPYPSRQDYPMALPHTELHHPNQFVFLEPIISPNLESDTGGQPLFPRKTKFKMVTTGDILSSSSTAMPSSKKRKTRSQKSYNP